MEIGKPLDESLKECRGECRKILLHTLESQKSVKEYHVICRHKDESEKNLILNSAPLTDQDETFEGAVLVVRDVTQLKLLEDKLRERSTFMNNPRLKQVC